MSNVGCVLLLAGAAFVFGAACRADAQSPASSSDADTRRNAYLEREAAEIAANQSRRTIGDYLGDEDPVFSFVRELGRIVFRDSKEGRVDRLTPQARGVYVVFCFDASMHGGGLRGYFENASGEHAHETLASLREMGAPITAAILAKSLSLFPDGRAPADWEERFSLLKDEDRYYPVFEDLTTHFYKRVGDRGDGAEEDLYELTLAYMKRHQAMPYKNDAPESAPPRAAAPESKPLPSEAGQLTREKLIGEARDVTATALTKAFQDDHKAALKTFRNMASLTVEGVVTAVAEHPRLGPTVELAGHGSAKIFCYRFEEPMEITMRVRVGKTVRIKGLWHGLPSTLTDAELAEVRSK
jgi:hypothetical protein